jgi:hypothetical protein
LVVGATLAHGGWSRCAAGIHIYGQVRPRTKGHVLLQPIGVSICNHGRADGTISSEVIEPREARLWWPYGWPCGVARGYEKLARVAWGRYVAFDVAKESADGGVTLFDSQITPPGVRPIGAVEGA